MLDAHNHLHDPRLARHLPAILAELARFGITRAQMDEYAARSHQRVLRSQQNGWLDAPHDGLPAEITPVFDYFVIATGTSRRQIHAMADEIENVVKAALHDKRRGAEGYEEGRWIVLDYGDVVVHLFETESREYWDLEHLWSDARSVAPPAVGAARDG